MKVDFVVNALFSALGLEPEQTKAQLLALQKWNIDSIKAFDSRLRALESDHKATRAEVADINRKLDLILSQLGVENGIDGKQYAIGGNGTNGDQPNPVASLANG